LEAKETGCGSTVASGCARWSSSGQRSRAPRDGPLGHACTIDCPPRMGSSTLPYACSATGAAAGCSPGRCCARSGRSPRSTVRRGCVRSPDVRARARRVAGSRVRRRVSVHPDRVGDLHRRQRRSESRSLLGRHGDHRLHLLRVPAVDSDAPASPSSRTLPGTRGCAASTSACSASRAST